MFAPVGSSTDELGGFPDVPLRVVVLHHSVFFSSSMREFSHVVAREMILPFPWSELGSSLEVPFLRSVVHKWSINLKMVELNHIYLLFRGRKHE